MTPRATFDDNDHELDERPSKSQRKRDMHALQEMGETLVDLPEGELATIPMDEELARAVAEARRIKQRGGLRRQLQFIGKLMRKLDTDAIEEALEQLQNGRKNTARQFQRLEVLRDRLLEDGVDALPLVLEPYPQADRQHLRQLIAQAQKEKAANKPPASARKLFRYLRELAGLND